jgi:UDPglucose 6-dehydrogenase
VSGKRVGVLGLTFKPNTDDMRDAPSIPLVKGLVERGAEVVAFDPVGREQAEPLLPAILFAGRPEDVAEQADAVVVMTEWDEFRGLSLRELAGRMRGNALLDLRNIYDQLDAERAGLRYFGIGRGRSA